MLGIERLNERVLGAPSVEVAGASVARFTEESLVERVMGFATTNGVDVAVGVNAHVCNLARRDPELRAFLSRSTGYADGQSVVWAARLLGCDIGPRLATTDIALPVLAAAAAAGVAVYFFGAAPGVAEAAAVRVRDQIPAIELATHHGYVAPAEMPGLLREIEAHRTGILFVGLGDPLQQRWVATHADRLPPAVLTCGGLFDWLSGSNRRAPEWMIRGGLEWLWRLLIEPRRLAKRYLLGNPAFLTAVMRQRLSDRGRR